MGNKFFLVPNTFIAIPDAHRAVVQSMATANLDQVIERMTAHGCVASPSDVKSIIFQFFAAIISFLLEGYRVATPWMNFSISIRGNFNGKTDNFSPDRHSIEVITNPGTQLRQPIRERAHVQKELSGRVQPVLLQYTDWNSSQRDSSVTPGGLGELIGKSLKFDLSQPDQGIFFIGSDGSTHRVDIVSHNANGQLTFVVPPSLIPGDYSLEVRASLRQGPLRSGNLEAVLTVS